MSRRGFSEDPVNPAGLAPLEFLLLANFTAARLFRLFLAPPFPPSFVSPSEGWFEAAEPMGFTRPERTLSHDLIYENISVCEQRVNEPREKKEHKWEGNCACEWRCEREQGDVEGLKKGKKFTKKRGKRGGERRVYSQWEGYASSLETNKRLI